MNAKTKNTGKQLRGFFDQTVDMDACVFQFVFLFNKEKSNPGEPGLLFCSTGEDIFISLL